MQDHSFFRKFKLKFRKKLLLFGAMQHGYEKCNSVVTNNVWQQYVWDTYCIVGEWAWLWSARKYRRSQI